GVAVEIVAVLVAQHGITLDLRGHHAAHAGLGAVAVGLEAGARVQLLVGHLADEVGAVGDAAVVARAHAPLVEVDAGVVDLLVGVVGEQVDVRMHRDRAAQAPAVGVAGVGAGGDVAALHVVVVDAVGRGGGEGQGGDQGGSNGVTLHEVDLHVVVVRPAERRNVGPLFAPGHNTD